ncbi:acetamidase/formamidase family protein [Jeotgalibacillus sp. R-1-5s-1]|uniref:acetamidase/formamidase family protein n=1 Tax=Jeotgalibacillus sp. R-1-5s-1 TaxID=2555897 RepID=UPI001FC81016|nr:acetamidase/formamidase family protein [Jeotgalibacillus sp. R-1-5s-1]
MALENEGVSCGTPGAKGGNMDTKEVTTSATLYFQVFHEGALLSLGDLHAAMGDGEISFRTDHADERSRRDSLCRDMC